MYSCPCKEWVTDIVQKRGTHLSEELCVRFNQTNQQIIKFVASCSLHICIQHNNHVILNFVKKQKTKKNGDCEMFVRVKIKISLVFILYFSSMMDHIAPHVYTTHIHLHIYTTLLQLYDNLNALWFFFKDRHIKSSLNEKRYACHKTALYWKVTNIKKTIFLSQIFTLGRLYLFVSAWRIYQQSDKSSH